MASAEHCGQMSSHSVQLLADLATAWEATVAWIATLGDTDLDRTGCPSALGEIAMGIFIDATYGHHLLHMRDLQALPG